MTDGARNRTPTLLLYTTVGCHLCEQAAELLAQLAQSHPIVVEPIEISDDEALVAEYGIRIPVVKNVHTGMEIGWPFQAQDLLSLI